MRVLIIDINIHHKNRKGLIMMLDYIKRERNTGLSYTFGGTNTLTNKEYQWDLVVSPAVPVNTAEFPNTKFIFGPHFCVFPNRMLNFLNNQVYNNAVYIHPSEWVVNMWRSMCIEPIIPLKVQSFPVDVDRFNCLESEDGLVKTDVFVYFKRRKPSELQVLENTLIERKINYKVFDYVKRYEEEDYLEYLKKAKYGIIVDAHESQGFAIQEAMNGNVEELNQAIKFVEDLRENYLTPAEK